MFIRYFDISELLSNRDDLYLELGRYLLLGIMREAQMDCISIFRSLAVGRCSMLRFLSGCFFIGTRIISGTRIKYSSISLSCFSKSAFAIIKRFSSRLVSIG